LRLAATTQFTKLAHLAQGAITFSFGRNLDPPRFMPTKQPFDFDIAFSRIREAIAPFARAALFELRDDGFNSPFEQLIACIISIRTTDEMMIRVARKFFQTARTPPEVLLLSAQQIDALIFPCTFHENKAAQILEIARRVVEEFGSELPCDYETLISFKGIGPKCANLVLGIACDQPRIGVDVHVHRITNRWGIVTEKTPEKTTLALEKVLPKKRWVEINELLVPFGKHICTGSLPKCSTCPVLEMCAQVGVTRHR
jgi:endonuclease-3